MYIPSGYVKIAIENPPMFNGKIHYFDWAIFNSYFDITRGYLILLCIYLIQWIGLRENLQETIDFPIKYGVGFSCKFSLKPIHWLILSFLPILVILSIARWSQLHECNTSVNCRRATKMAVNTTASRASQGRVHHARDAMVIKWVPTIFKKNPY